MTQIEPYDQTNPPPLGRALGRVLGRGLAPKERVRAFGEFGAALKAEAGDLSRFAEQGADVLESAIAHMPIRHVGELRAEYGAEGQAMASGVIDDAARFAAWVWTAAGVFPAPPPVVHAAKVLVHSAVEIRMIGELDAISDDPARPRDGSWLTAVLNAWAVGHPVPTAPAGGSGTWQVALKLRQAHSDLASRKGRIARIANRGREGSDLVRQFGLSYLGGGGAHA